MRSNEGTAADADATLGNSGPGTSPADMPPDGSFAGAPRSWNVRHRANVSAKAPDAAGIPENLRNGGLTLIAQGVRRSGVAPPGGVFNFAAQIEASLYAGAADRKEYVLSYAGISRALPEPFGDFLEGRLAEFVADGRLAFDDLCSPEIAESYLDIAPDACGVIRDPRRRMRGELYAALRSDPRLAEAQARDFATRIESSCYNATIARCVGSEHPVRRLWDDFGFVTVYNARVGVVLSNLDPESSVARTHGPWAIEQLLAGTFSPDEVGGMEAAELCPRASEEVRAEIRLRSQQKVVTKESSLYRCPTCKARRHTIPGTGTQMAAPDEGSTYMVSCLECGDRFEGKS